MMDIRVAKMVFMGRSLHRSLVSYNECAQKLSELAVGIEGKTLTEPEQVEVNQYMDLTMRWRNTIEFWTKHMGKTLEEFTPEDWLRMEAIIAIHQSDNEPANELTPLN